ncbi:class I SAM-dependent methyltransferase [Candidatus Roizmanbacteria bacterium]|nr:class I SAM-dependent methyltransferase [Candidatus Roizmanbacteria bacterium]
MGEATTERRSGTASLLTCLPIYALITTCNFIHMTIDKTCRGADDASVWDEGAAARYAKAKHGPDGARFLDPHLYSLMSRERLAGSDFLDLGAGAGPWSQHALEQGARTVTAVDLNEAMLEQARTRLRVSGELPSNVNIVRGDVADLVFADNEFDRLASVNVGCNLPDGTFQAHFREAKRVARRGGRLVVTAPDSLLVSFTTVDDAEDIQTEIDGRWSRETAHDSGAVKRVIDSLRTVLRATFVLDEAGRPVLVTEENVHFVREGTPIIRRIPGLAVDNNFHTAKAYIEAAERAGWKVHAAHRDSFGSDDERREYNGGVEDSQKLGSEYVGNPSFLIMDLEKQD